LLHFVNPIMFSLNTPVLKVTKCKPKDRCSGERAECWDGQPPL